MRGGEGSFRSGASGLSGRLTLLAAFGAVWFIWGSTYLAIAWAVETIPPLLMIGARCLAAGSVLYAWGRLRGGCRPGLDDWRRAGVAGVLLFVTGQAVLAWAETRVPSGAASLLIATEPLFIALLAWRGGWLTGADPVAPPRGGVLALLAGFAGVALLTLPGSGAPADRLGETMAVLAALSWSLGVFRAGSPEGIPAGQNAGMQLLVAGPLLLGVAAATGEMEALNAPSVRSVASLAYLVVFGSLIAFGAYVWLLDRVGPSRLSTHAYVNPLVAIVLGSVLNREPIGAALLAASGLILGSVALLLRAGRAPREWAGTRPRRTAKWRARARLARGAS